MPILEELIQEQPISKNLTATEESILLEYVRSKITDNGKSFQSLIDRATSQDFNTIQIQPQPGFVCKTKETTTHRIVYINICHHQAVPEPTFTTELEIQKALNAEPSIYKVPVNMGKERTEGGNLIMDACIHTQAYLRSEKDLNYRLYIIELCMEYIEEIKHINLSREFTMPTIPSKGIIPSRLLKLPKPTLLNQFITKEWKLQPNIQLQNNLLTVIIPMSENKNFASWTIDITTNNIILTIDQTSNTISLPNQIDINHINNKVLYYKKSNHLIIYLNLLCRTQYL